MTRTDFLTEPHTIMLDLTVIVPALTFAQRLALIQEICETLAPEEPISEIRAIVNNPLLNE